MKYSEIAWLAGVIDVVGSLGERRTPHSVLPMVSVHTRDDDLLNYLCRSTGVTRVEIKRDYAKQACTLHCQDLHIHVFSVSGRWQVIGARATSVLMTLRPYLRLQAGRADELIELGLAAPVKEATFTKMRTLGWRVPSKNLRR